MQHELIEMLRCPVDQSQLARLDASMVNRINKAIGAGVLFDRSGRKVDRPMDGGLVRADGDVVYPIVDHIPIMLPDAGIPMEQLVNAQKGNPNNSPTL